MIFACKIESVFYLIDLGIWFSFDLSCVFILFAQKPQQRNHERFRHCTVSPLHVKVFQSYEKCVLNTDNVRLNFQLEIRIQLSVVIKSLKIFRIDIFKSKIVRYSVIGYWYRILICIYINDIRYQFISSQTLLAKLIQSSASKLCILSLSKFSNIKSVVIK